LNEERQWPLLAKSLGREDLINDSRFAAKSDRYAHSKELVEVLDEVFASKDRAEWESALQAAGIVFEAVASPAEISHDSQLLENRVLVRFQGDQMLTVDSPFFVGGPEKVEPQKPPSLGQHTDEVLKEFGYDVAAIGELRAAGAVK
jgi:formyl-CoA transferase